MFYGYLQLYSSVVVVLNAMREFQRIVGKFDVQVRIPHM